MLECKVFKDDAAPDGARVAIQHKLHVQTDGWQLLPRLETVRDRVYRGVVAVAYKDGVPVACVLVRLTRDGQSSYDIAAYCKMSHRRQGITSHLMSALREHSVAFPRAVSGSAGSHLFWHANGVRCAVPYEYAL